MKKIKLHIDTKAFNSKPQGNEFAGIKYRLQKNNTPKAISLQELVDKISRGYSISPAVMNGTSSSDWQEQQLFMIDIDNNTDTTITPENALKICKEKGLPVAFYYNTFSNSTDKPKFRLAFIMSEPVKNENNRKAVVTVLHALFEQSDKACVNADRIFLGSNSKVVIVDENARITMDNIYNGFTRTNSESSHKENNNHESGVNNELEQLKNDFDFLGYLKKRNGECRRIEKGYVFKNCEICGHHDDLVYYIDTNTFYCFSSSGEIGGSIIDYLIKVENLSVNDAINKFKYELCGQKNDDLEWKNPVPLNEDLSLPPFPTECLPKNVKEFVNAIAENTATSPDMAGSCALSILSTVLQGKFETVGKQGYTEPLNLYLLIIAKPGERKSAIVKEMTKSIYSYEKSENKKRQPEIDRQEFELKAKYNLIEQLTKKGKVQEAFALKEECRKIEETKVHPLRLIADDITPEALATLLADNQGRLSIISTEGGLFDTLAGRYSNFASIDTILKAHCGDPIRIDRKGRETEIINNPLLTMLLTAQDNVLEGLLSNDVFKSRGLTARILFCKPKSLIGTRQFDTPHIPNGVENNYNDLILSLLEIPYDYIPRKLEFNSSAKKTLLKFYDWLEPKLAFEYENMGGWAEKFFGTTLRIAGILHCAENKSNSDKVLITKDTLRKAIKIAKFFLKHAEYTYSLMGADKGLRGAIYIVEKLKYQSKNELTKYEIFRMCRGCFEKTEDALPSLELLLEYEYLKEQSMDMRTGGRPRGNKYILNPLFFKNE